jgi:hypothetical protein
VRQLRRDRPNDVVNVFIPEYVVGHWWEQLLHNQSALRLKGRLLFQPGVMVTSVPWQMDSSRLRAESVAEAAAQAAVGVEVPDAVARRDDEDPPLAGPVSELLADHD